MTQPRTALVTGGNRGIGLAVAESLAAAGHRVAVTHRGDAPEKLYGVRCDVTSPEEVEEAFTAVERDLGPVGILVANAGITWDTPFALMTEERFGRVIDTNLVGAYRCARRAVPAMLRARWGRIVFIGSEVGLSGNAGQANYAASKAGLVGLARSLARETGRRGITVNTVAPGFVDTDMTRGLREHHREEIVARNPVPRIGTPADVASAVTWLADESAGYVTGAVVPVDGGMGMGG
ncbi:3-oxoacyl-ACP reductase FabG [Streptomyces xinghaiensis]|uniref:3-oxoacyl-ACP reductase FabG n=1 Tax=Streptomyces xinghaiensis TaxID=1038928 RepID=UPI00341D5D71